MSNSSRRFNYQMWGLVVAVVSAIAAVATVPAIGCFTRLNPGACTAQLRDVELIAQSEIGEPLSGVKIQVIAQGAPEVLYTDNNGYAKVKVPSEGDVRINLTQEGYPVQDFNVNVGNSQSTVRVVRFSKSGRPDIEVFSASSTPADPTTPGFSEENSTPAFIQSSKGIFFQLKSCTQENDVLTCELLITDEQQQQEMYLYSKYSSNISRAVDTQGNQHIADSVSFGGETGNSYVRQNLPQGIGLKASIIFDEQVQDSELALVEVTAKTSEQGYFSVQFRDVPISK